jgi:hypothetical protein
MYVTIVHMIAGNENERIGETELVFNVATNHD